MMFMTDSDMTETPYMTGTSYTAKRIDLLKVLVRLKNPDQKDNTTNRAAALPGFLCLFTISLYYVSPQVCCDQSQRLRDRFGL